MSPKTSLVKSVPRHSGSHLGPGHKSSRGSSRRKLTFLLPRGRYVEGIVRLFYHRDDIVRGDPELQAWCREITEVGLCQAQDRGRTLPQGLGPLGRSAPLGSGPQPRIPPRFQPRA